MLPFFCFICYNQLMNPMKEAQKDKKVRTTATKRLFRFVDKAFYKSQNPPRETAEVLSRLTVFRDITPSPLFPDARLDLLFRDRAPGDKYPVIFHIHGGGFSAGDKSCRNFYCAKLALLTGAAVINVNHPLGPEETAPIPLRSLVQTVNWVKENAEKYSFDLNKALVTGDSSGAYYAAMLSAIPSSEKLQSIYGEMKMRFGAAVFNCGIFDLVYSIKHPLPFGITRGVSLDITGLKPKKALEWEYMPYACPVRLVTPEFPRSLVIYSKKDFFAKGQAEAFLEELRSKGVYAEEFHSTKFLDNHAFSINLKNRVAEDAREKAFSFINSFFNGNE